MLIEVTDPADPRLRDFTGLRDSQLRRSGDRFIAEGVKIIQRAFAAGCRPRGMLLQPRWLEGLAPLLGAWPELPVYVASEEMIERISGFHVHRGALGSFDRPPEAPWALVKDASRVLVCEEIVDHTNLGAIVRVALGLGWDALVLSHGSADPLYRRAVKASMGGSLELPWLRLGLGEGPERLRAAGFTVVAATLSPLAVELPGIQVPERVALLLGTEGAGLSAAWQEGADLHVRIPMTDRVDSLNVATAAAILAYELRPADG
ncbi:tRNA G18 (ribose-2'-O)-methylase SpoU [Tessaracoccus bendigoensis DSM 12906]|uniref:tRNA G18 (Ribose-2'-O)-methylase SpoU n=1 Tax=Tessaracoccus bendigoensis DSM 12906 TaxID=1123357 RepID=A0A1M6IB33_9ACTN|nr:RNA methyltransferase [Tessaracoccus bendigoensis]SHJ31654.1 tRNA G18 (ribose-2'-O)-methylase SpoU [Tessaracoccus bendigoensis DSM 12906]